MQHVKKLMMFQVDNNPWKIYYHKKILKLNLYKESVNNYKKLYKKNKILYSKQNNMYYWNNSKSNRKMQKLIKEINLFKSVEFICKIKIKSITKLCNL
jgi:hypothetical protein